jgi:hypothetical protein
VDESPGGSLAASLGVSGDQPCEDKEEPTGKEGGNAATALCYSVPASASSGTPISQETDVVKWSQDESDKTFHQSLGIAVSSEPSREVSLLVVRKTY